MLQFTEKEIREQVESILHKQIAALQPIGNHHLKRHLVYKVTLESGEIVIYKVYYKTDRRNREIATLKKLTGSQVRCPALLKYGYLNDGTEWLLMTALEGVTLEQVQNTIAFTNQLKIFQAMGEELGKLHSFARFDFYGNWDEDGRPLGVKPDYGVSIRERLDTYALEIRRQGLAEEKMLLDAIHLLKDHVHCLTSVKEFHLVHNDFDGRNILVQQNDGEWELSGVIDFEGCSPGNTERDLVNLYHRYFIDDPEAERAFLAGYAPYCTVDEAFFTRLPVYLLNLGVGICSWGHEQAIDYYFEGVGLVERWLHVLTEKVKTES